MIAEKDIKQNINNPLVLELLDIVKKSDLETDDLSLLTQSAKIGCSKKHLSASFKKHVGVKYTDFLQFHRIKQAQKILKEIAEASQPFTIDELMPKIGLKVGTRAKFDAAFEAYSGERPSAFLKRLNSIEKSKSDMRCDTPRTMPVNQRKINKIIDYVDAANLETDDLSLKAVSEKFQRNRARLTVAFKDVTGVTYTDYVQGVRVNAAIKYLMSDKGSLDIEKLKKKVGLKDTDHFKAIFQKHTGQKLKDYKKYIHDKTRTHVGRWVKKLNSMRPANVKAEIREQRMMHIETMMRDRGIDEMIEQELHLPFQTFLDKIRSEMGWDNKNLLQDKPSLGQ